MGTNIHSVVSYLEKALEALEILQKADQCEIKAVSIARIKKALKLCKYKANKENGIEGRNLH